jgi:hypothetical protein
MREDVEMSYVFSVAEFQETKEITDQIRKRLFTAERGFLLR